MPPASAPTAPKAAPSPPCLLVSAGGARLSIDCRAVAEYGVPGGRTPVPGTASWLLGLAQWRGRLLTVVDAGLLFGGGPTRGASILVLRGLPCETALAVDQVLDANDEPPADLHLDAAVLTAHPAFQPGAACGRADAEA
jgi:chemotaxis signal transduction protein